MSAPSKNLLTIVSPCFNEARNLEALLPDWLEFCRAHSLRLILVDDGSTDDTQALLRKQASQKKLCVIRHKVNRGYGAAIKSGIKEVLTPYGATMDADGQHDPREVLRLLAGLRSGGPDMVIGRRKYGAPRFLFRSLGKGLIRLLVRYLFSRKFYDLNSGMKVFRADLAKKHMGICPDSMAFSEIFALVFVNNGHLVEEQAVSVGRRRSGSSTIRLRTAFQTVWKIVIIATLFKPAKIFLPLSALLFLAGVGWEIPILLAQRGISVGASLLIILAILFMLLGLIAEQLSVLMKSRLE